MFSNDKSVETSKGYEVSGLQRAWHPKINAYRGWSGRLRVVGGDPYYDEWVGFNSDGSAFKHDFGDLQKKDLR